MQETAKTRDKFELFLDEKLAQLQACQQQKNHITCSNCERYFDCDLRQEYVKAVYNSMSKGDTGGFEF
jgi:hypothetical protein